jgi:hypothetical protein
MTFMVCCMAQRRSGAWRQRTKGCQQVSTEEKEAEKEKSGGGAKLGGAEQKYVCHEKRRVWVCNNNYILHVRKRKISPTSSSSSHRIGRSGVREFSHLSRCNNELRAIRRS